MPKISELNAITSVANTDLLMVVHDPSGSPSTNKITVNNFITSVSSQLRGYTGSSGTSGGANNLPVGAQDGQILFSNGTTTSWKFNPDVKAINAVYETTTYTATEDDCVLLVVPATQGQAITITLPGSVPVGKTYIIRNIDSGGGQFPVTVTTTGVIGLIEEPHFGTTVSSYDIQFSGDTEAWIFDGNYYRNLSQLSSSPVFLTSANSFHQVVIQNISSANNSSSDWVAYNDQGDYIQGTGPFIDMGINSSEYTDTTYGDIWKPNDGYIYNQGGNLIIASQSADSSIKLAAGNTNLEDIRLEVHSDYVSVNTNLNFANNKRINLGNTETWIGFNGNDRYIELRSGNNTSNSMYTWTDQNDYFWETFTEYDGSDGHSYWSWIISTFESGNKERPKVFIQNHIDANTYTWEFSYDGAFLTPSQPSSSRTGSGEFLKFRNTGTQKIIGTDNGNVDYPIVDRVVISGGDGYNTGEGGDVYLWAGRGAASGGTGGDIKVDAGLGYVGDGGTVKIRGGNSNDGTGGFIEIRAGTGGGANGSIRLIAGDNQWTINENATLSLPAGGDILNSDGYSVIKSIPQNQQSSASDYTLVLSDAGKHIYKNEGEGYSVVVPTNADVAFPIGTVITVVSGDSWTYIYPADQMTTEVWGAGYNTTSTSFYIPNNSMATLLKIGTDKWMLSGAGLGNDV